ncbi:MAG: hypothetical protein CFE26_00750 [Verrucomicrobiales bacterium VVV1]|nr:MAG: hypothetical protein CFE26_00750 [Verrucomicrobiales bacterium VVV1]
MIPQSSITLENASAAFRPFDEIRGTVTWTLEKAPKSLELRLFWFTTGRGTAEAGLVEVKSLPATAQGTDSFSFHLPGSPYSISGSLITLQWALELVAEPIGQVAVQEFTLAPGKQALTLPVLDSGKKSWWKALQGNR